MYYAIGVFMPSLHRESTESLIPAFIVTSGELWVYLCHFRDEKNFLIAS